ncbi:MAG: hypothetical protein ACLSEX_03525 [Blautia sp.]
MKDNLTELVFILDRSGSMSGLEKDTIGGFTSMLTKQKALDGQCRITTVLFNNHYTLLHDRIDIQAVSPMTEKEYFVGGSTALLTLSEERSRNLSTFRKIPLRITAPPKSCLSSSLMGRKIPAGNTPQIKSKP